MAAEAAPTVTDKLKNKDVAIATQRLLALPIVIQIS